MAQGVTATDIAKMLGVWRATVYRYLAHARRVCERPGETGRWQHRHRAQADSTTTEVTTYGTAKGQFAGVGPEMTFETLVLVHFATCNTWT